MNKYSIHDLAKLAGVTVRLLHYYDEVKLLCPKRTTDNNYRSYTKQDLFRLQQILLYKNLGFPLQTIKEILDSPDFNYLEALKSHRENINSQIGRLNQILVTIDITVKNIEKGEKMDVNQMYGGLTKKQMEEYSKEARERWGNTQAYQESVVRVKRMGKAGLAKVVEESKGIILELAKLMDKPKDSKDVQELVKKHRENIGNFYTVTDEIYEGLAHMYVDDPRFKKTYDDVKEGLADFLSKSMLISLKKT